MTEPEFNNAAKNGQVEVVTPAASDSSDDSSSSSGALPTTPIEQFIPILTQLESQQQCLTVVPTAVPQTFQEQIQFVYTGGNYYLYLYFNNQWNAFSTSSGGGGSVAQLLAGTGISISPSGGTGTVTITNTGITSLTTSGTSGAASVSSGTLNIPQYQGALTLTTTGTSGAATLSGTTLNIPQYTGGGGGSGTFTSGVDNSRFADSATSTQTIAHGLGATPKYVSIRALFSAGTPLVAWSEGVYNGSTTSQAGYTFETGAGGGAVNHNSSTNIIELQDLASNGQAATITWDATNIYLAWTKVGGGSAGHLGINFMWEANT